MLNPQDTLRRTPDPMSQGRSPGEVPQTRGDAPYTPPLVQGIGGVPVAQVQLGAAPPVSGSVDGFSTGGPADPQAADGGMDPRKRYSPKAGIAIGGTQGGVGIRL